MKKLSLVAAAMILFAGVSFAQDKTTTTKTDSKTEKKSSTKTEKKGGKMDKKEKKSDKAAK